MQAAKVITSDMMNSHMANFLEGMANGRASIGGAVCAPTVKCASLTVPPVAPKVRLNVQLQLHPKQHQQIHPKNSHEVPVVGERVQRAPPQNLPAQFTDHISHAHQTAQHV